MGRYETYVQAVKAALKFKLKGENYQIFKYRDGTYDFLIG